VFLDRSYLKVLDHSYLKVGDSNLTLDPKLVVEGDADQILVEHNFYWQVLCKNFVYFWHNKVEVYYSEVFVHYHVVPISLHYNFYCHVSDSLDLLDIFGCLGGVGCFV